MVNTWTNAPALERARHLVALGLSVLPITPGTKHPPIKWKNLQERHPEPEELEAWFERECPVGIVCGKVSGLVVVDSDSPEAEEWAAENLPPTPWCVRTGESTKHPGFRGVHRYYRHPGVAVRNRARIVIGAGKLALDVRADGGQVLSPGSQHPSGVCYEAMSPEAWTPEQKASLPLFEPAWLEATPEAEPAPEAPPPMPRAPSPGRPSGFDRARAWLEKREPAVEGQGGDAHTFATACSLVRGFDLDDSDALALLQEWNATCRPPWTFEELAEKVRNARAYGAGEFGALLDAPPANVIQFPRQATATAPATAGALALAARAGAVKGHQFERTDPGQAEYLLALADDTLRHCAPMRYPWLVWSGTHWKQDRTALVQELAIKAARQRLRDAVELQDTDRQKAEVGFALGCLSASRRRAVVDTAAVFQAINVLPEALDADPWVLNCQNGTLCLRTGELRPHRREDYLTRVAPVPYEPSATCPLWEKFLARVMADNADVIAYLQRAAGYCLTGSTGEEVFFLLHGPGRNGKGVFVETLAALLGDLAEKVPVDLLCDSRRNADAPSPHLAKLPGVRLVHTSEAEENRRLGEAFVKEVTGGDTISAAAKFQDPIQFRPQFKLLFSTNHRPDIRGTDEGIWSRVHLVPFSVTIPPHERDKHLKQKLLAELPGILAWAVRGCLEWQRVGLNPPAEVLAATASYRAESDVLGAFLADCTTTEPPPVADGELFAGEVRATVKELRNAYQAWCLENGERPISSAAFGRSLDERGFPHCKGGKNVSYRRGIRLFTAAELALDAPTPAPSEGTPEAQGGLPGLPGLPRFQVHEKIDSHEGLSENRVTQVTQVTHEPPEELVEELI